MILRFPDFLATRLSGGTPTDPRKGGRDGRAAAKPWGDP